MPLIDWDGIARGLGYEAEGPMLRDLYETQELGLNEIGARLGTNRSSIRQRILKYDIKMRARGGSAQSGKIFQKLFRMDQRVVFGNSDADLARALKCSISYVHKYKLKVRGTALDKMRQVNLHQTEVENEPRFET